jgi:hypothetical protein
VDRGEEEVGTGTRDRVSKPGVLELLLNENDGGVPMSPRFCLPATVLDLGRERDAAARWVSRDE